MGIIVEKTSLFDLFGHFLSINFRIFVEVGNYDAVILKPLYNLKIRIKPIDFKDPNLSLQKFRLLWHHFLCWRGEQ